MDALKAKKGFICDMDGVIYHGDRLLPDVKEFVEWLYKENKSFLFLTNSSERSPRELQQKLGRLGLDVDESDFMLTRVIFIPVPSQRQNLSAVRSPAARHMLSARPDSSTRSMTRVSQ